MGNFAPRSQIQCGICRHSRHAKGQVLEFSNIAAARILNHGFECPVSLACGLNDNAHQITALSSAYFLLQVSRRFVELTVVRGRLRTSDVRLRDQTNEGRES